MFCNVLYFILFSMFVSINQAFSHNFPIFFLVVCCDGLLTFDQIFCKFIKNFTSNITSIVINENLSILMKYWTRNISISWRNSMTGQVLLLLLHQQPSLERCQCQAHKLLCMIQSYLSNFLVVYILYVCCILLHHIYGLECLFYSCSPYSQYKIQCWTTRSSLCGHVSGVSII